MKALAIIPARGGSKRIPRKNIRNLCGRPIIHYPIRVAIESGCFTEVMVSTDDAEISSIARESGAALPFLRSAKNSDDRSTTADVIYEVLEGYRLQNTFFDLICCVYPTAALVTASRLCEGMRKMMSDERIDSVIPVLRYSHPTQRALVIDDSRLRMIHPENALVRSQDLEPSYHDAGQWYWLRCQPFLKNRRIFGVNSMPVIIDEMEGQDIDSEADWRLAELKMQLKQSISSQPTKGNL